MTASRFLHLYCGEKTAKRWGVLIFLLVVDLFLETAPAYATNPRLDDLSNQEVKAIADGLLTVMSFTVLPDITTSSLSLGEKNGFGDRRDLSQTTFGGGFTISKDFPLYLEGTVGYTRFDPKFVFSGGEQDRKIPAKWNIIAATGGIGHDYPLTANKELTLRSIFNFTLGHVATDLVAGQALLNYKFPNLNLEIIDGGQMSAYGLGGR